MEFKEELKKYASIVNQELEKHIIKDECPEEMLNASMEYSLISSGKRIRPTLMLATYRLFKEDYETCMPFAVAIEMVSLQTTKNLMKQLLFLQEMDF